MLDVTYRIARRIVIAVVGGTVVLIGAIMLVTPGPGLIVIPAGLAILAMEFAWARNWLDKLRRKISSKSAEGRALRAEARRASVYDNDAR